MDKNREDFEEEPDNCGKRGNDNRVRFPFME